jgi:hypothetical protein
LVVKKIIRQFESERTDGGVAKDSCAWLGSALDLVGAICSACFFAGDDCLHYLIFQHWDGESFGCASHERVLMTKY